jgi:hypothetical protein
MRAVYLIIFSSILFLSLRTARAAEEAKPDALLESKQSLLHDLNIKNVRANREYGVRINLGAVEDYCLKPETTLLDCQKEIQNSDDHLSIQITQAKLVKEQRRANDLKEREIEKETNTTVIYDNDDDFYDYPRVPINPRPRPPVKPRPQPPELDPWTRTPKPKKPTGNVDPDSGVTIQIR